MGRSSITRCHTCDKSFADSSSLRRHKKSLHPDPTTEIARYKCRTCNAVFARKDTLTRHEAQHQTTIPACEICSRRYPRRDYLATHRLKCAKDFLERACEQSKPTHRFPQHKTEGVPIRRVETSSSRNSSAAQSSGSHSTFLRANDEPVFAYEFALDVNLAKRALAVLIDSAERRDCFEDYEDALLAAYHLGISSYWIRTSCPLPRDSRFERWDSGLFILEILQVNVGEVHSDYAEDLALNSARGKAFHYGFASFLEPLFWKGADVDDRVALNDAIEEGHVDLVRFALILHSDLADDAALALAVQVEQWYIAFTLTQHGVDINHTDNPHLPMLEWFVRSASPEKVRRVLQLGADPTIGAPLRIAFQIGRYEVASLLMKHGADINGIYETEGPICLTILQNAVQSENIDRVRQALALGADPNVEYPLHEAFLWGNIKIASLLIKYGADVCKADEGGRTVLHIAAINCDLQLLQLALKWDSSPAFLNAETISGSNALHIALRRSPFLEALSFIGRLLEAGADISATTSDGLSPLALAARHRCPGATSLLLEKGADPSTPCRAGCSALFQAIRSDDAHSVRILIAAGADVHESIEGFSLLELALVRSNASAIEQLLEAGARGDGLGAKSLFDARERAIRELSDHYRPWFGCVDRTNDFGPQGTVLSVLQRYDLISSQL